MILGMSLATFTLVHVAISLVGIAAGFVVLYGLFTSKRLPGWTAVFLATTILTDITGYFFPFTKVLPSHIVGVISLVILAVAVVALYLHHLAGGWRWVYIAASVAALYLNVFVGVVQAFLKIAFLHELAPKQSDPAFIVTQALVMVAFVAIGILASRSFHPTAEEGRFASP
jgi:hypothetical protein